MSDLDAELLALAGDSSDDEGQLTDPSKNNTTAKSSDMTDSAKAGAATATNGNGPMASPAGDVKKASPGKSPTPKKRAMAGGDEAERANKRTKLADSEQHATSSRPSTSSSLQSAPMSESDSATEARIAKVKVNGRSISAKEKAKIMSLPEIQREALLADRATHKERDKQNRMLMQLLRGKGREDDEEEEIPDKKRKADTAELGDQQRRSTRQKTTLGGRKVGESSAALDEYSKNREQKRAHAEQRKKEDAKRSRARAGARPTSRSSADADGESGNDAPQGKRVPPAQPQPTPPVTAVPEQIPTLREYNRCRVGRSAFGQVCLYPGFDEAIAGCFVRVNIGNHPQTGEVVYRMAQIKRFTEGERYAVTAPNGRNYVINQFARASHGKAERDWPFIMCSDGPFTEAEVERFHRICREEQVPLPTARFVREKVEGIHRLIHRTWTEAELQTKLVRQNAIRNGQAKMHITQLKNDRKAALASGNEEWLAKIDYELSEFNPKLAFGTKLFDRNLLEEDSEEEARERARAEGEEQRRRQREMVEERSRRMGRSMTSKPKPATRRHLGKFTKMEPKAGSQSQPNSQATVGSNDIDDLFEDHDNEDTKDTSADAALAATDIKPQNGTVKTAKAVTISRPSLVDDDDFLAAIDLGIEIPEL
ncbi:MAG: hypothetical protein M1823_001000 [Watsoniomyces obsoletus]|nr:MAG: hypothetical protein M1823_001000 [Watsoniomyces obsoletus]